MTRAVELAQIASSFVSEAFKNRVINGNMLIWQRGTSGSSGYVADRWQINSSNTTVAQSTDVPSGFRFSCLMTGTNASNAQITQRIESLNCSDLAGQPITVSFWGKSTAGSTQLGVYIQTPTAQDNYSSVTQVGSTQTVSLTSTWTQYSITFTTNAPSSIVNGIQLGLFRSGTESSTTFITGVQLEVGTSATSFEYRPISTELMLCQRYYEQRRFFQNSGSSSNNPFYEWTHPFIVEKRATPTMSTPSGGTFTTGGGSSNPEYFSVNAKDFTVRPVNQNTWSAINITWAASAELA